MRRLWFETLLILMFLVQGLAAFIEWWQPRLYWFTRLVGEKLDHDVVADSDPKGWRVPPCSKEYFDDVTEWAAHSAMDKRLYWYRASVKATVTRFLFKPALVEKEIDDDRRPK